MRNKLIRGDRQMDSSDRALWLFAMVVLMVVLFAIFRDASELVNDIIVGGSVAVTYIAVLFVKHRREHSPH